MWLISPYRFSAVIFLLSAEKWVVLPIVPIGINFGIAPMIEEYEEIDNIKLIRNNLRHIDCELESDDPSSMRLAKECHQILLRMMVEARRGTANLAITGRRTRDRKHWYRQGDDPWKMIQKENIKECDKAWRYSNPLLEAPPPFEEKGAAVPPPDDHLFGFYDLLAMIQTPCFMIRYVHSAVVSVSDAEMRLLEWLHESIRNDFEHFIPKILLALSDDCLEASETCLRLAIRLVTTSNNIAPVKIDGLPAALDAATAAVLSLKARLNDG
jgi:hypothetical protein